MAGRTLNRRELRRQSDQADQIEQEAKAEPKAKADPKAKAAAPAKPKRVRKKKAPARMCARWGVFDAAMKQVAVFDYNQRGAADLKWAEMRAKKKVEAEQKRAELVCSMANDFDSKMATVLDSVSRSAEQMSGFSMVMADKMNEAERGTVEISRETNNTISNVGNIAAATEELSATTSEIALRINQSVEVARNTATAADQTTQTISDLAAQGSRSAPDTSIAVLVTGANSDFAELQRATVHFPPEVNTIGLRIDPSRPIGIADTPALVLLDLPHLGDLAALLRGGGIQ